MTVSLYAVQYVNTNCSSALFNTAFKNLGIILTAFYGRVTFNEYFVKSCFLPAQFHAQLL